MMILIDHILQLRVLQIAVSTVGIGMQLDDANSVVTTLGVVLCEAARWSTHTHYLILHSILFFIGDVIDRD